MCPLTPARVATRGTQKKEGDALQRQVDELLRKREELSYDEQGEIELGRQQHARQAEHAQIFKEEEQVAGSLAAFDFKYTDPQKGFDRRRVKGTVASNLRVPDAANATALEALAGGRLHQVIVDDEQTGMQLLKKGGLQRRVTLIPLSVIRCASPCEIGLSRLAPAGRAESHATAVPS